MILTRRNFLRSILPAAAGGLVLAEELLHPGRVFFLPPRNFAITYDHLARIDIEAIIKKALAADMAKVIDEAAFRAMSEGISAVRVTGLPQFKGELLTRQQTWDVFSDHTTWGHT